MSLTRLIHVNGTFEPIGWTTDIATGLTTASSFNTGTSLSMDVDESQVVIAAQNTTSDFGRTFDVVYVASLDVADGTLNWERVIGDQGDAANYGQSIANHYHEKYVAISPYDTGYVAVTGKIDNKWNVIILDSSGDEAYNFTLDGWANETSCLGVRFCSNGDLWVMVNNGYTGTTFEAVLVDRSTSPPYGAKVLEISLDMFNHIYDMDVCDNDDLLVVGRGYPSGGSTSYEVPIVMRVSSTGTINRRGTNISGRTSTGDYAFFAACDSDRYSTTSPRRVLAVGASYDISSGQNYGIMFSLDNNFTDFLGFGSYRGSTQFLPNEYACRATLAPNGVDYYFGLATTNGGTWHHYDYSSVTGIGVSTASGYGNARFPVLKSNSQHLFLAALVRGSDSWYSEINVTKIPPEKFESASGTYGAFSLSSASTQIYSPSLLNSGAGASTSTPTITLADGSSVSESASLDTPNTITVKDIY